jgi:murein L,D-transpeptidase YcbB/YkuD
MPGTRSKRGRGWKALPTAVVACGLVLAGPALVPQPAATWANGGEAELDHARVEVSLSARQVSLYRGGEREVTYRIAVGKAGHETPTGQWHIHRIDFNPDWRPPDSEWAADAEYKEPGHPDNPMGRMRILFEPPYSIHGTDVLESIGEAASHGSIRIANEDGWDLARRLMDASGERRSESWWWDVRENETEMVQVELSNPVPIRIRAE